ncbi:MAG: response regulator [Cytophagales bacterium]
MTTPSNKIRVGIVDDHQLFTKSLTMLINSFLRFQVVLEASNGKDLQKKLNSMSPLPQILLIDVNMPLMNGLATAEWVAKAYPSLKMVALSMNDEEETIIQMFRAGCSAYLFKDIEPTELERALDEVHAIGYFNPGSHSADYEEIKEATEKNHHPDFSVREREFLKLCCSELTYKEISQRMAISQNTVDSYRETMFKKLKVNSRTAMVLKALRKKLIKV